MAQELQLANGMSDFTCQDNFIQPEFQLGSRQVFIRFYLVWGRSSHGLHV